MSQKGLLNFRSYPELEIMEEQLVNNLVTVKGITCWGAHTGVKTKRRDLGIIFSEVPANVSAAFTQNRVVAEPVKIARETVHGGKAQCIVINSGNANACTGEQGRQGAMAMIKAASEGLNINRSLVQIASTGIIGRRFPTEKVVEGIRENLPKLSDRQMAGSLCANAILTTDTFSKEGHNSFEVGGKEVNMAGIAKGSGMIHPDMGTMLSFIVCDIDIDQELLDRTFKAVVDESFNMITVDGDTSTNDEALILCNGMAGNLRIESEDDDGFDTFRDQLKGLCQHLAKLIVSDGEGATKMIEYKVSNAQDQPDARRIVRTVSNSSLVKTAVYGQDPNWGRIIAAAGRAGADLDPEKVDLFIGSGREMVQVLKGGRPTDQDLEEIARLFKDPHVRIHIDLNLGKAEAMGWGADLTEEYVRFNSEYTT